MKHVIFFLTFIFMILFFLVVQKNNSLQSNVTKNRVIRIFGYSSFTGRWGPGPILKEMFEKQCDCEVEFLEASDSGILLQRLRVEGESLGVDVVIGLDQFDIGKANKDIKWKNLDQKNIVFNHETKDTVQPNFLPFDWGVLAFVVQKKELQESVKSLDDLLAPHLQQQIAIQDPRTSSPGFQFLYWLIKSKGEDAAFEFLTKFKSQIHSISPSWSTAYGLFSQGKAQAVFSYATSPIFHSVEEKNDNFFALPFAEPHPMQVEFVGIPEFCSMCDLAEQFVNLMLSKEGQKVIMQKNYMFPVIDGVTSGTVFEKKNNIKTLPFEIPADADVDRWLQKWSVLRRQSSH